MIFIAVFFLIFSEPVHAQLVKKTTSTTTTLIKAQETDQVKFSRLFNKVKLGKMYDPCTKLFRGENRISNYVSDLRVQLSLNQIMNIGVFDYDSFQSLLEPVENWYNFDELRNDPSLRNYSLAFNHIQMIVGTYALGLREEAYAQAELAREYLLAYLNNGSQEASSDVREVQQMLSQVDDFLASRADRNNTFTLVSGTYGVEVEVGGFILTRTDIDSGEVAYAYYSTDQISELQQLINQSQTDTATPTSSSTSYVVTAMGTCLRGCTFGGSTVFMDPDDMAPLGAYASFPEPGALNNYLMRQLLSQTELYNDNLMCEP